MALYCRGVGFGRLLEGMRYPLPMRFAVVREMECVAGHTSHETFQFVNRGHILLNPQGLTCEVCGREMAVRIEDDEEEE